MPPRMTEGQRLQVDQNLARMPLSVVIAIQADGTVSCFPPFIPSRELPDVPAFLRHVADVIVPT